MVSAIQTGTNPSFKYEYEKSLFVPPEGKSLLIVGQTKGMIRSYTEQFPDQTLPGGWMAYWGIPEFKGITGPHRVSAGNIQDHSYLVGEFPNSVIQSAMWMIGNQDIAENTSLGMYDDVIRKYGEWVGSTGLPIYLRIGYEFDGPHNELEPEVYKRAYRHVVDLLREQGVQNVAYVWHSYAAKPYKNYSPEEWYPGDDYVDWIGISVFSQAYEGPDMNEETQYILSFARAHKKPVMIAEANPVYGIPAKDNSVWNKWFVHFFTFIYRYNIKAVSFINEDWPQLAIPGTSDWKDSRLWNNEQVSRAWLHEINKDRYLKASDDLFRVLGFSE